MTHGLKITSPNRTQKLRSSQKNVGKRESMCKLKIIKYLCGISSIWSSFFRSFIAKEASPVSTGLGAESAVIRSRCQIHLPWVGGLRPWSKGAAGFGPPFLLVCLPEGDCSIKGCSWFCSLFCSWLTQEGRCHPLQLWGSSLSFLLVIGAGCVWGLGLSLGRGLILLKLPPWVLSITLLSCHKFQVEPWDVWYSYGLEKKTHTGKR